MRRIFALLAFCALLEAATVTRASITAVEDSLNRRFRTLVPGEPYLLLGESQGVYLEGYGVVFTASFNLLEGPNFNPFRQSITPKERVDLRQRKLDRLPKLRDMMREAIVVSAGMLDAVPANEQVVISVSLPRYNWEDATGLPSQIVMQANRVALVNLQVNPPKDQAAFQAAIRTREY